MPNASNFLSCEVCGKEDIQVTIKLLRKPLVEFDCFIFVHEKCKPVLLKTLVLDRRLHLLGMSVLMGEEVNIEVLEKALVASRELKLLSETSLLG